MNRHKSRTPWTMIPPQFFRCRNPGHAATVLKRERQREVPFPSVAWSLRSLNESVINQGLLFPKLLRMFESFSVWNQIQIKCRSQDPTLVTEPANRFPPPSQAGTERALGGVRWAESERGGGGAKPRLYSILVLPFSPQMQSWKYCIPDR